MVKIMKDNRIQTIFNTISKDYDQMNDIISFKQHDIWRKKTMAEIFLHDDDRVLDLCCGTGDWTIQLAEVNKNVDVTGLDFSENMLAVAKDKVAHFENIKLIQGDAMELPFDDNSFDLITIGFGLRNLPNYKQALIEVFRVLKPGGQFVILETSNPNNNVIPKLFNIYFAKIRSLFGQVVAKSGEEYKWLYESTRDFLAKEELKDLMSTTGFINIRIGPHSMGIAPTHFAHKPLND